VIFAPLTEPGSISIMPVANLARETAAAWQWHHQNQVNNFDPFLSRHGIAEDDTVAFGRVDDVVEMSVASLRQWTHDYLLPLQVAIVNDAAHPRYHWLVVRHGDGSWSHGATCRIPTQE
jgi:hypothetical protein